MTDKNNFETGYDLFDYIFENEIFECNCYYYYQSQEEEITWRNQQINKIVESNKDFNKIILELIVKVVGNKMKGGMLNFKSCKEDNEFGFTIIYSGYSDSMLDDLGHEGEIDSIEEDEFLPIEELVDFDILKEELSSIIIQ